MSRLALLLGAFGLLSAFGSSLGGFTTIPPSWRARLGFFTVVGLLMAAFALLAAILLPEVLVVRSFREIWTACSAAFQVIWHHPIHRLASILAGVALALMLGRFMWAIFGAILATRRARSALGAAEGRLACGNVVVLDAPQAEAFSIGGRRGLVVITRGLVETLEEDERMAALLHEEGHLRSGHHLTLSIARAAATAMGPFLPARRALEGIEQAVEEAADEYAAEEIGSRLTVASGLSKAALAGLRAPAGALSLGDGPDIPARVHRLMDPPSAHRWTPVLCVAALIGLIGVIASTQYVAGLAMVAAVHHLIGIGAAMSCPLLR